MSPTARSLKLLRSQGYVACIVEKWIPSSPAGFKGPIITRDAWNFGDILCCKVGVPGALLVQTTSGANVAARVSKIRSIPEAAIWLAAGNRIVVHGFSKRGARGKAKHWECREVEVTVASLESANILDTFEPDPSWLGKTVTASWDDFVENRHKTGRA